MTTTIKRELLGLVWVISLWDLRLSFGPNFLSFVEQFWLLLENSPFRNFWRINFLVWEFPVVQQDRLYPHQVLNKSILRKGLVFISLVDPSEPGKSQLIYNSSQNGTFQSKFDKLYFFSSTLLATLWCYAERNWKSRDCSRCKLWNYRFIQKQRYKVIDNLWQLTGKKFAIPERLLTLLLLEDIMDWVILTLRTTCFIEANLGKMVKLQNSRIVSFKSPFDVMQISTLSAQTGHESELVDCYRDAISVPIYSLTCRYKQTIDYVSEQTQDPFLQSIISRTGWNNQKIWTVNTQSLSTLQVFQLFSHKCKNRFLQSCPEEIIRFLRECLVILLKRNLQSLNDITLQNFSTKIDFAQKILGNKEETFWHPRTVATPNSHYSSRH